MPKKQGPGKKPALSYGNADVAKEAFQKNRGGSVTVAKATGGAVAGRADRRARGGAIAHKASGGSCVSNPWSSAHKG